jgi:hypothetical protein
LLPKNDDAVIVMNLVRVIGTATASLLLGTMSLGTMIPLYAQQEDQGAKQTEKKKVAKKQPVQHKEQAKPQEQPAQEQAKAPQRTEEQARAWQKARGWQKQGAWQGRESWQQDRAQRWSSDHRTWEQRGGYGGLVIPQDRLSSNFGSEHSFRLGTRPAMFQGYPRFEYGGFSFLLVDPWPEYWAENWYDLNDVYIDYDGGYYLHNRNYPQVRLAIMVSI